MNPCDLLISGGHVLDLEAPGSSLDDHAVVVVDDRIVAVAPQLDLLERWPQARTIDANDCVLAPGSADAHVHLSAST